MECCIADHRKPVGVGIDFPALVSRAALPFGEAPGRVVVSLPTEKQSAFAAEARKHGIAVAKIGVTGGNKFHWNGFFNLPLSKIIDAYYDTIPQLMGQKEESM